ncbi:hypothetical protein ABW19_dt0201226 [Dactylella cylindrospora]|nr:hypothetical protein ABW19_dt0201226 [Dactylella cylindrospora]
MRSSPAGRDMDQNGLDTRLQFFSLPREIRDLIYGHLPEYTVNLVLSNSGPPHTRYETDVTLRLSPTSLSLKLVSRQFREEMMLAARRLRRRMIQAFGQYIDNLGAGEDSAPWNYKSFMELKRRYRFRTGYLIYNCFADNVYYGRRALLMTSPDNSACRYITRIPQGEYSHEFLYRWTYNTGPLLGGYNLEKLAIEVWDWGRLYSVLMKFLESETMKVLDLVFTRDTPSAKNNSVQVVSEQTHDVVGLQAFGLDIAGLDRNNGSAQDDIETLVQDLMYVPDLSVRWRTALEIHDSGLFEDREGLRVFRCINMKYFR